MTPPVTTPPALARLNQDFFHALIKGSQSRPGFITERERWLRSLQVDGREELLFEFEMLLRGLERYFNLHNLPTEPRADPVIVRDFRQQLVDVRDAMTQAIRLARRLLDPDSDQKLVFRRYVETQLQDDRIRRQMIEEELQPATPPESLFVLRESLAALRTIVDHLLKHEPIPFALFNEVGTLALREIVLNPYFRPFRPMEFRLEYDRLKSVLLLEGLRKLDEPDRRLFTVALLAAFRVLHYLSYVGAEQTNPEPRARVVLALVRSEAHTLIHFLQTEVAPNVTGKRHKAGAVKVARDLQRESERVIQKLGGPDQAPQASLEAAAELTGIFRKQVETLARTLDPQLSGEDLFVRLMSPEESALRLRKDLWVFAQVCRSAEGTFRDPQKVDPSSALEAVKAYLEYFQEVSYQLLRYVDYEAFDRFHALVQELEAVPEGPGARGRFADDLKAFAQVAESSAAAVSRRAELIGKKFDRAEAEALLGLFWLS